uniref:Phosphoprotein n=5 Tax=Morbillivirus ceti TaxID=3052344 RepID=A0A2I7ZG75_9MONO|nr:phosphoprotein [Morbillivirus ceti]AUS91452.1 phosphoprotein [Dolphin morbillivirus]AEO51053.1 phosphoprotein [Morbillivirus ceti]AYR16853.1 phosphoprotein [Morbillivirus ceti]QGP72945.1 phosphoprotein [Dolphin morbillivirus]
MAEEQAYHVNKGLECLKSLRENPPDAVEIKEAQIIRSKAACEESSESHHQDNSEKDTLDFDESCSSAIRPETYRMLLGDDTGFRAPGYIPNEGEPEPGDIGKEEPAVRCYHVYDHGGQEVEGVKDADLLVVPTGSDDDAEFRDGDESSLESDGESGTVDTRGSSSSNRGSAPRIKVERSSDVETISSEELQGLIRSQSQKHNGFGVDRFLKVPPIPTSVPLDPAPKSIKKGTGERSALSGTETEFSLTGGATRLAQESRWASSESSAPAENVRQSVTNAERTQKPPQGSGTTASQKSQNNGHSDDEYEDELFLEVQEIKTAITKINEDNQQIISKLDSIMLLKGEIESIKKQINKQNITISTIEGHLSSIMIAIPGFGKDPNDPTADVELNPDLRPIISRDAGRALAEVLKRPAVERNPKVTPKVHPGSKGQILRDLQLKPVDRKMSSAVGFVPTDDLPSRSVLRSMIKSSNLESEHKRSMIGLLNDVKSGKDLGEFYQMVKKIIK